MAWATIRAVVSVLPPAAKPTSMRMGRSGFQASACAARGVRGASGRVASAGSRALRCMASPPGGVLAPCPGEPSRFPERISPLVARRPRPDGAPAAGGLRMTDEAAFEAALHAEGFQEVVRRAAPPGQALAEHAHGGDVRGLVLRSRFSVAAGDALQDCGPGEVFTLAAGRRHTEAA